MSTRERILKRSAKAGLRLHDDLIANLDLYFGLLRRWNRKVSLTALPVEEAGDEAIDRLLVEPVLAARHIHTPRSAILDIGSGGGSPAVPMRLAAGAGALRMVESKTRKAAFLREVIRTLKLDGAEVDAVRSEELLARPALHDAFDVVSVRAVRIERKTLNELQSFAKPSGLLFLFGTAPTDASELTGTSLAPMAHHELLREWGSTLDVLQKRAHA